MLACFNCFIDLKGRTFSLYNTVMISSYLKLKIESFDVSWILESISRSKLKEDKNERIVISDKLEKNEVCYFRNMTQEDQAVKRS